MKARETADDQHAQVMADIKLDAIFIKLLSTRPTLIKDGVHSAVRRTRKGAPHINTFLMFVPSIVVPAGFPAGTTGAADHVSRRPI